MKTDVGEPGALEKRLKALLRIKPLGVELVGYDAALGVDYDLPTYQAIAIAGQIAFAADEVILVDPLPGARLEMVAHPVTVHQIHDERTARAERALYCLEYSEIVLRALEITERVAEDADAMELTVAKPKAPRIAFVKRHLEDTLLGALAGEADQITRAVKSG